ncbi:hypothetical protein ACFP1Z_07680 [Streptomyces gamaensis]|uniref:PASTA domain-containing protein n=1 Tax=Streptomyces gamaensis TaxID=1763542 RepID=A0ABW0YWA9_9ACTN
MRKTVAVGLGVLVTGALLVGCDGKNGAAGTVSSPSGAAGTPPASAPPPASADGKADTAHLPDVIGKRLPEARKAVEAAGFRRITPHDASGRDRAQVMTSNWKVCTQKPEAGKQDKSQEVALGVVKVSESCPAKDSGAPEKAGDTVPDLKGKSVKSAYESVGARKVDAQDASGRGRHVLVGSNWQVCSQSPRAGEKLGEKVVVRAVKYGESCP